MRGDADGHDERVHEVDEHPAAPPTSRAAWAQGKAPPRHLLKALLGVFAVLVVAARTGDALLTTLADTHPLVLLMLNARTRTLLLVSNQLDPVSFYVVGFLRLVAVDPVAFLLGWFYGDRAVAWVEERSETFGSLLRSIERGFSKAAYPLVAIAPNEFICLFAGSSGMHPAVFVGLNATGTLVRLFLIRRLGEAFNEPIESVLGFFADYRVPLLVISVILVGFMTWNERRSGHGELEQLRHLEEELEGDLDGS